MKTFHILFFMVLLAFTGYGGTTNQSTSADSLERRIYKMDTGTFVAYLKHESPPKAGETDTEMLVRYFKQKQVEIKPPESVFWDEQKSLIIVRATNSDLDKIEDLILEVVGDGEGSRQSVSLTAEHAHIIALRLANEKADALFHCQPFHGGQPPIFSGGRWVWTNSCGVGLGDIQASVELAADGSTNHADIQLFDSHERPALDMW